MIESDPISPSPYVIYSILHGQVLAFHRVFVENEFGGEKARIGLAEVWKEESTEDQN